MLRWGTRVVHGGEVDLWRAQWQVIQCLNGTIGHATPVMLSASGVRVPFGIEKQTEVYKEARESVPSTKAEAFGGHHRWYRKVGHEDRWQIPAALYSLQDPRPHGWF